MDQNFFQKFDILAFLPDYCAGIGEITKVLVSQEKDQLIPVTSRSFKANLCKYYSIDYESSRKKFGRIIGSINCVPLPINSNKIFLQLKVRVPEFRNDSAMGYIDLNCIKGYNPKKDTKNTEVVLKNDRTVRVLCGASTINKHMKNARLIHEYYKRERGYTTYPETLEKLYSVYDKPATKADIAILAREIATLKNSLKVF